MFILGDLFEIWLGDDAVTHFESRIADALSRLAQSGVELAFIRGNRDFMLGPEFCRCAGMRLLEEPQIIDLYGTPTVLLHGDVLCTEDVGYQRLRAHVQNPQWQQKMLRRPVWLRRQIANWLRRISRIRTRGKSEAIMDVSDAAVQALFRSSNTRRMIHGHTHRPDVHRYGSHPLERIVLGDWHRQGSVLYVDRGGFELMTLGR